MLGVAVANHDLVVWGFGLLAAINVAILAHAHWSHRALKKDISHQGNDG